MNNNLLSDLRVQSVKYSYHADLHRFKITHDYLTTWMVILLLSGRFLYSIEQSGEHCIEAGQLLILPPYYNIDKTAVEPVTFALLSVETDSCVRRIPLGNLVLQINDRIREDIELIGTISQQDDYRKVLGLDLWHQICRLYCGSQIPMEEERDAPLKSLLEYIDTSLDKPLTLEALCKYSGYSKSSLIRQFRIYTGKTPMQYVSQHRINFVKKLLGDTRLTLREIAAKCGYANEFYLSAAFKRQTGISPSAFRSAQ